MNGKDLVLVDSTCRNLRRLALAVASQKPVLIEGPTGCGKTALVEHIAAVTGHTKPTQILKVQLGDQTDSKVKQHGINPNLSLCFCSGNSFPMAKNPPEIIVM